MDFRDYLKLNIKDSGSALPMTIYITELLTGNRDSGFKKEIDHLIGVIDKFNYLAKYHLDDAYEELIEIANSLLDAQTALKNEKDNDRIVRLETKCRTLSQKLFTTIMGVCNKIEYGPADRDYSEFKRFYIPEHSNKKRAIQLIEEAINFIEKDEYLQNKAKDQLINNLNKTIKILRGDKTNWKLFYGNMKESLVVLSLCCSIISGAASGLALYEAHKRLSEATKAIEESSINENYLQYVDDDDQHVFQIEQIKLLPEKTTNNDIEM